ncbi:MAG: sigma-70 family RNA polymerase sigma factor [Aliiglaciecola sp.]|uniref:RNA polymerase sigma factor n=1 Tax=Aliiglaciecola sp. TaxID=1872441 RepID=UPI0032988ED1
MFEMITSEYLVDRIASGETRAEQQLVDKYWKSLFFILKKQSDDDELANDISQDTFLIVIDNIRNGKIENRSAIGAYIRQTGINLLIAHFRKESRRKTEASDVIDVEYPDSSQSLSNSLHSEKLVQIVRQVIKELPAPRDRDILYRYFVYGQTKKVICDEFDLSPEHFDRVLFRARSRLKQVVQLKLDIDLDKNNLISLLALGLALQYSVSEHTPALDTSALEPSFLNPPSINNLFLTKVREILSPQHLIIKTNKED